jgi:hypothetical protein
MKKLLLSIVALSTFSFGFSQNVLIIYDDSPTNTNTLSLKTALEAASMTVTISDVSETAWDNTNPSLTGFDAVIHLNGTTYGNDMPLAGQNALVDYVTNNSGLYIGFEWNNYEFAAAQNRLQQMRDLILTDRGSGATNQTLTIVSGQESHPVLNGVSSFTLPGDVNGTVHVFATEPVVELMTVSATISGVLIRDFQSGHILNMTHAGNYDNQTSLSDSEVQKIIINFINAYKPLSTVSLSDDKLSVSPTVVDSEFNITTENTVVSVSITDVAGRVVYAQASNSKTVNVASLAKGAYFVKVATTNGEAVKRIVKN